MWCPQARSGGSHRGNKRIGKGTVQIFRVGIDEACGYSAQGSNWGGAGGGS